MGRGLRYSEFSNKIDMERFYEAIEYEPISTTRSGDDLGYCPDPWGQHKNSDSTGKFAIHPEKRLYNCVSRETLIHTSGGLRRAGDLVGTEPRVLTEEGTYKPAKWYSYGVQRLFRVTLENGDELFASAGHEWVVTRSGSDRGEPKRVTTLDLRGHRIPMQAATGPMHRGGFAAMDDPLWRAGVRHGLVYGDGTRGAVYGGSSIRQFGDENCALVEEFFNGAYEVPYDGMRSVRVGGLPRHLKDLPTLDEPVTALMGFMAGLLAADGHVSKRGSVSIAQSDRDALEKIRLIAAACGIPSSSIRMDRERNPWTGAYAPSWRLTLLKSAFVPRADSLVLKQSHRDNLAISGPVRNRFSVLVVGVEDTGRDEEVVCCVEPDTHTMVIGPGYLTGQCWVCGGGTLLDLVMAIRRCDDEEAIEWLYQFAVQTEQDDESFLVELDDILRVVQREKLVLPHFNEHVLDKWGCITDWPDEALDWVTGRGIDLITAKDFRLGYGIVQKRAPRKDGVGIDDDYTGPSIIFPHYWHGKLVGWQNRWLADETPKWLAKYTNTTEFPKSYTIFNFDRASRRTDPPVVVESVPTVMFLESHGVSSVATFGSSVPEDQLRVLRRFQQGVILAPDNDKPGEKWLGNLRRYLERYVPVYELPPVGLANGADLGDLVDEDLFAHLDRWS